MKTKFNPVCSLPLTAALGLLATSTSAARGLRQCLRTLPNRSSKEPDVKKVALCIALDRDCADIRCVATRFMARGSGYSIQLCALCAVVCQACRDECKKHQNEHCQNSADACRQMV